MVAVILLAGPTAASAERTTSVRRTSIRDGLSRIPRPCRRTSESWSEITATWNNGTSTTETSSERSSEQAARSACRAARAQDPHMRNVQRLLHRARRRGNQESSRRAVQALGGQGLRHLRAPAYKLPRVPLLVEIGRAH